MRCPRYLLCVREQKRAVTDLREILLPGKTGREVVAAMACLSTGTLATQIHPNAIPPTTLFVTVSRILPSQI